MDVAAEHDETALVEGHGRVRVALVDRQLEMIRVRERVDVVCNDVAVRELDQGAGLHDEQVRHEALVDLVDDGSRAGRRL